MAEVREAEYRFGIMCGELDDKWLTIIEGMAIGWALLPCPVRGAEPR